MKKRASFRAELAAHRAQILSQMHTPTADRQTEWYSHYGYIVSEDCFFHFETREKISRPSFDALFRHINCRSIHTGRVISASVSYDELRPTCGGQALSGWIYAPGEGAVVNANEARLANSWRNGRPNTHHIENPDASPWLERCEQMIPHARSRGHLLDVMALKLQQPSAKIGYAILHASEAESVKNLFWEPFFWAIAGNDPRNITSLRLTTMRRNVPYADGELLVITKTPDGSDRHAVTALLRQFTMAETGVSHAAHRPLVVVFSDEFQPIEIDQNDNNWFCLWSSKRVILPEKNLALSEWYSAGGRDHVAAWLMRRDVSQFSASAPPPFTEYGGKLRRYSRPASERYLAEAVRSGSPEFVEKAIVWPSQKLLARLQESAPLGVTITDRAVTAALKDAGWQDRGDCRCKEHTTRKNVWAHRDVVSFSPAELRRCAERAAALAGARDNTGA